MLLSERWEQALHTLLSVVENSGRLMLLVAVAESVTGPILQIGNTNSRYRFPVGAKFGLFMHWGVFSVPAYKSEWYEKHMYGNRDIITWHQEHFGPPVFV